MLFKYFTDKDTNQSIAINPQNVLCVREMGYGTKIIFIDSSYVSVVESQMETATRLSEQ
jgi:L-fucose mutarotase/ribose pyranase (RbsD/FucU family)